MPDMTPAEIAADVARYPPHLQDVVRDILDPQPCVVCGSRLYTTEYGAVIDGEYTDAYVCQECPIPTWPDTDEGA